MATTGQERQRNSWRIPWRTLETTAKEVEGSCREERGGRSGGGSSGGGGEERNAAQMKPKYEKDLFDAQREEKQTSTSRHCEKSRERVRYLSVFRVVCGGGSNKQRLQAGWQQCYGYGWGQEHHI